MYISRQSPELQVLQVTFLDKYDHIDLDSTYSSCCEGPV